MSRYLCGDCAARTTGGSIRPLRLEELKAMTGERHLCEWCGAPATVDAPVPAFEPQHWHAYECTCGALWDLRRNGPPVDAPVSCPVCGTSCPCSAWWPATPAGYGSRADECPGAFLCERCARREAFAWGEVGLVYSLGGHCRLCGGATGTRERPWTPLATA